MKKFLTVLCDGMADYDDEHGLTPMDEANKPTMDKLCKNGTTGLVTTVPDGMKPGSDVCNLAALGYNPKDCYTGRSPLEALSIGIDLDPSDVTYRVNFVTLGEADEFSDKLMLDYSAGEISSNEGKELISALKDVFAREGVELFAGTSYRNIAVIRGGANSLGTSLTPPHDISGKPINGHLPDGILGDKLTRLIKNSQKVLAEHPVNAARIKSGKNPANAVWFWGEGTKPILQSFSERFGKKAAIISAVDLLKGIGKAGAMTVLEIPTATGTFDTDYAAKTAAAMEAFKTHDYVFIHFEGPDECGHQGDRKHKIEAIERIDKLTLAPLLSYLEREYKEFAISVMPDHATPLCVKTHTSTPIPFLVYDKSKTTKNGLAFSEKNAAKSNITLPHGSDVINILFGNIDV